MAIHSGGGCPLPVPLLQVSSRPAMSLAPSGFSALMTFLQVLSTMLHVVHLDKHTARSWRQPKEMHILCQDHLAYVWLQLQHGSICPLTISTPKSVRRLLLLVIVSSVKVLQFSFTRPEQNVLDHNNVRHCVSVPSDLVVLSP